MTSITRSVLVATLMLPALLAVVCCTKAPAQTIAQRRDSPPPQPMPPPQVVPKKATDPVFNPATVKRLFPIPTQQLIDRARTKARKEWRPDATVTQVRYQWVFNPPDVHAWTGVTVNSASDGAQRLYQFGDVVDGQVLDFDPRDRSDAKLRATANAIGDIQTSLEQAMTTAQKLGYVSPFMELDLQYVGAKGKPRVPAWRLLGTGDGKASLFPLTINALTGGVMDWRDAYQTPNWSDAEIAATFKKLFNVPPPRNLQVERYNCELIGGNWMPWDQCDR